MRKRRLMSMNSPSAGKGKLLTFAKAKKRKRKKAPFSFVSTAKYLNKSGSTVSGYVKQGRAMLQRKKNIYD